MAKKKKVPTSRRNGAHYFRDKEGSWCWHIVRNGEIMMQGEGHDGPAKALRAMRGCQRYIASLRMAINDKDGSSVAL